MSLLELEAVHKRHDEETAGRTVLRDVSLQADAGELVVIWGLRRSGRSTLLRVAAGIEPPDAGVVRFDGHNLADRGERLLGKGIGYCQRTLRFADGHSALDHTMVGLLSRWVPPAKARLHAHAALERTGVAHCARMTQRELSSAEVVRVRLARTLALRPRMVVIDEPVKGVELGERDPILALLRSLADEGLTVLSSTGESTGLSQADLGLVLGDGQLRGAPARELAPVVPLHPGVERQASG
ncbi:MAG TPA: ATP-binding cassette domain-containing protein [Solirubrobacteraceae bacterium]|jgi:ABC-type cobalamin/Fe3+-siderophores transport system ATPase subunit|nr:ATP-binding cassette domain-containing protein [Solirubrobacteraceae bacterium]